MGVLQASPADNQPAKVKYSQFCGFKTIILPTRVQMTHIGIQAVK